MSGQTWCWLKSYTKTLSPLSMQWVDRPGADWRTAHGWAEAAAGRATPGTRWWAAPEAAGAAPGMTVAWCADSTWWSPPTPSSGATPAAHTTHLTTTASPTTPQITHTKQLHQDPPPNHMHKTTASDPPKKSPTQNNCISPPPPPITHTKQLQWAGDGRGEVPSWTIVWLQDCPGKARLGGWTSAYSWKDDGD